MKEMTTVELQSTEGGIGWFVGILLGLAVKEIYDGISQYLASDGCCCGSDCGC